MTEVKKRERKLMEPLVNRKARHEFTLMDTYQAGVLLEGWEVKAILARRINFDNAHIIIQDGEAFLFNVMLTPLESTSTHMQAESTRRRKLLLHKKDIKKLYEKVKEKTFTLVPSRIYQVGNGKIKVDVCLAKGKKEYDKREDKKNADLKKDLNRLMKHNLTNKQ